MRAIKNYHSEIPIHQIFAGIQKTLAEHGAKRISFEYADDGTIAGVFFAIALPGGRMMQVKLPARVEKAQTLLKQQYDAGLISRKMGRKVYDKEHAYRVAWRNIWDRLEAQMALLDIEMVKLEEIFLPYIVNQEGKTLFEHFEDTGFQLPSGEEGEARSAA